MFLTLVIFTATLSGLDNDDGNQGNIEKRKSNQPHIIEYSEDLFSGPDPSIIYDLNKVRVMPVLEELMRADYGLLDLSKHGPRGPRTEIQVIIEFIIDTSERVLTPIVYSSTFEEANPVALKLIKSYKFKPAEIDGLSVAVKARLPINFTIN